MKKVAIFVVCLHAIIRHLFLKHLNALVNLTYLAATFHSQGYKCCVVYPTQRAISPTHYGQVSSKEGFTSDSQVVGYMKINLL